MTFMELERGARVIIRMIELRVPKASASDTYFGGLDWA